MPIAKNSKEEEKKSETKSIWCSWCILYSLSATTKSTQAQDRNRDWVIPPPIYHLNPNIVFGPTCLRIPETCTADAVPDLLYRWRGS